MSSSLASAAYHSRDDLVKISTTVVSQSNQRQQRPVLCSLWLPRALAPIWRHHFVECIPLMALSDANSKHFSLVRLFTFLFSNALC